MVGIQEQVMMVHIWYLLLVLLSHIHSFLTRVSSHCFRSPCTSAGEVQWKLLHNKKSGYICSVLEFLYALYTSVFYVYDMIRSKNFCPYGMLQYYMSVKYR